MKLSMIGTSHHRSRLEIRERLAFTPDQAAAALATWREQYPATEAVLLSTCNRVEFYAATDGPGQHPGPDALASHLATSHAVPVDEIRGELVTLSDADVIEHLFRVAASLDSMVLGEPQILAQVKQAYELACDQGSAGPLTHGCFQAALRVARRVASETELHKHRVSIPSVAIADFACQIFEHLADKQVLVIGAGEMADETLRYLREAGAQQFTVVNRSATRAAELARQWQGIASPWSELHDCLVRADLVVSTTAAGQPIVTLPYFRQQVAPQRQQRPLFVLDLALPRDFEPAIGDELGVYLYSIDDLAAACQKNRKRRERELPRADQIVRDECQRFLAEARHRATAPVIAQLRDELEAIKAAELRRLLGRLGTVDDVARAEIEQFAARLVNKLLHPPMRSLRDEADRGTPHGLLDALRRLFQLKD